MQKHFNRFEYAVPPRLNRLLITILPDWRPRRCDVAL